LVADPLIRTLYGEAWIGAIGPLRILAFYGLFHAVAASCGEVFKATGNPRFVTLYAVLYNVLLGVMLYALGTQAGLMGVSLATLGAPLVVAIAGVVTTCRLLPLGVGAVGRTLATPLVGAAAMAAAVLALSAPLHRGASAPVELGFAVGVGVITYWAVVLGRQPASAREMAAALGLRRLTRAAAAPPAAHP
jgi:PST family polysaccharide transporter